MDFLDPTAIIGDSAMAIYGAEAWILGVLESRMHMVWVRAVAGRLESRIRYSAELCYNTFPAPRLDSSIEKELAGRALEILEVRERFAEQALGDLYAPDQTPKPLAQAHQKLDAYVDSLYRKQGFDTDDERLALLFELYSDMSERAVGVGVA